MEGLDKLHLVHARLLYIIGEIYRQGRIDDNQKLSLKECVFQDDPQLFEIYEENNQLEDLERLIESLLILVKDVGQTHGDMSPDEDDQLQTEEQSQGIRQQLSKQSANMGGQKSPQNDHDSMNNRDLDFNNMSGPQDMNFQRRQKVVKNHK